MKGRRGFALMALGLAALLLTSRTPAAEVNEPEFEVVSIRPVPPNAPNILRSADFTPILPGGRFSDPRTTLFFMIAIAYDVNNPSRHLLGLPKWAHEKAYAVSAQPADGFPDLPPEENKRAVKAMLRRMLAKHFQLKIQKETWVGPIYRLVVDKGGLKIPEVKPAHPPVKPGRVNIAVGDQSGRIIGRQVTMEGLATALSLFFDAPVRDETGLKGYYDLDAAWKSPDPDAASSGGLGAEGLAMLISNLRSQFGLRLTRAKGPADYWVVQHVALPTQNNWSRGGDRRLRAVLHQPICRNSSLFVR
ncbi:MAG TPA: TIGR03435 family protein [Bryobacteraceae bacterium]|nr:TIGR03435 family protein [Bryobacteraceae bacterium]HPU74208.1 TIGR03435 family protein [Bryobacteraceae bacterium]